VIELSFPRHHFLKGKAVSSQERAATGDVTNQVRNRSRRRRRAASTIARRRAGSANQRVELVGERFPRGERPPRQPVGQSHASRAKRCGQKRRARRPGSRKGTFKASTPNPAVSGIERHVPTRPANFSSILPSRMTRRKEPLLGRVGTWRSNPVTAGSGVSLKVLDYLASGAAALDHAGWRAEAWD